MRDRTAYLSMIFTREIAAQLAEINEHLKVIAHPAVHATIYPPDGGGLFDSAVDRVIKRVDKHIKPQEVADDKH
jgi:hypothetical protein